MVSYSVYPIKFGPRQHPTPQPTLSPTTGTNTEHQNSPQSRPGHIGSVPIQLCGACLTPKLIWANQEKTWLDPYQHTPPPYTGESIVGSKLPFRVCTHRILVDPYVFWPLPPNQCHAHQIEVVHPALWFHKSTSITLLLPSYSHYHDWQYSAFSTIREGVSHIKKMWKNRTVVKEEYWQPSADDTAVMVILLWLFTTSVEHKTERLKTAINVVNNWIRKQMRLSQHNLFYK